MYNNNTARINKNATQYSVIIDGATTNHNLYGFTPLRTGDLLPALTHPTSHIILPGAKEFGATLKNITPIPLNDLGNGNKPLVIVFRPTYNHLPLRHVAFLDQLQRDIQIMGGSLLVISNASIRDLNRQLHAHNNLWILSDPQNNLAEHFGLYTPENPIGDWLSGIEQNIALPAFFIVLPNGEISFSYVDYNFNTYQDSLDDIYKQNFVKQLLSRVYQNTRQFKRYKKTAFKHG